MSGWLKWFITYKLMNFNNGGNRNFKTSTFIFVFINNCRYSLPFDDLKFKQ
jgi:hypothetical protein